jgi:hypothetical protein
MKNPDHIALLNQELLDAITDEQEGPVVAMLQDHPELLWSFLEALCTATDAYNDSAHIRTR